MWVGGDHVTSVEDFHRVPQGKAVLIGDGFLIESLVVKDQVHQIEPLLVLFCIVEPCTRLPVQIDYKVEY